MRDHSTQAQEESTNIEPHTKGHEQDQGGYPDSRRLHESSKVHIYISF